MNSGSNMSKKAAIVVLMVGMSASMSMAMAVDYIPWDGPLNDDSWMAIGDEIVAGDLLQMRTVNGAGYAIGFDGAKSSGGARGMNSLKFSYDGNSSGHLEGGLDDSFKVSIGGTRTITDLIVLVAIDSSTLGDEFSFSMAIGDQSRQFDSMADFAFIDASADDAGRPGGYCSSTSPGGCPLSYDFDSGMVTAMSFSGLSLIGADAATIDYEFSNLPGKAVFSLYGKIDGSMWVYHTNRGVADGNDAGAKLSTFEVVPTPEPCSLVMLGVCSLAVLGRRQKCMNSRR